MRRILNITKHFLLSMLALFAVLAVGILAFRAYRQHVNAGALAIHTANGIDEGMYVKIGGIQQWIQIRGQDRDNPVLLCLHGGPGASWLGRTTVFLPWEKEFTVVQWDQRGTGKTLETTGRAIADTMSVERMAEDGIEVSEFLRVHLRKEKIILLGHSWGSILGVHMVKERPDLFYAYVGTGQVSDMPRSQKLGYADVLEKARAAKDIRAWQELESIGPPPFDSLHKIIVFFGNLGNYEVESDRNAVASGSALTAPNYSLWDIYNFIRGFSQVPTLRVYQEMLSTDLRVLGPEFKIPVYFFQGTADERTFAAPAKEYFQEIQSPRKEFVVFKGGGHFIVWSMPDRFLQELVRRVRPLASSQGIERTPQDLR